MLSPKLGSLVPFTNGLEATCLVGVNRLGWTAAPLFVFPLQPVYLRSPYWVPCYLHLHEPDRIIATLIHFQTAPVHGRYPIV